MIFLVKPALQLCGKRLGKFSSEAGVKLASTMANDLLSVDYEVYGRVQGVFFRKYTQVMHNVMLMITVTENKISRTFFSNVCVLH